MDNKEFKKIFGEIAKINGFERAFDGWFKESAEVIAVLDLQKSNFSNLYYLNIKLYIQGVFENTYVKSKDLVKKHTGNIFLRPQQKYSLFLDLEDSPMLDLERKNGIEKMFQEFIVPFVSNTSTKQGIKKLYEKKELTILTAVKEELGIL